jgi:hypothetical protein
MTVVGLLLRLLANRPPQSGNLLPSHIAFRHPSPKLPTAKNPIDKWRRFRPSPDFVADVYSGTYSLLGPTRGHRGAEVPAGPQLAEQRRRTPQEGPGAADECGAML